MTLPLCGTLMKRTIPSILSLILAISLGGGAVSPLFVDCRSRCAGESGCNYNALPMAAARYASAGMLVKEINSTPCHMDQAFTFVAPVRVVRKMEPLGTGAYTVQIRENSALALYLTGRAWRTPTSLRVAPEQLYLQNLTLLI
jgi:hypothetical protein